MTNPVLPRLGVLIVLSAAALGCRTSQAVALDRPVPRVDAEETQMTAPNVAPPAKTPVTSYVKPPMDELRQKLTPLQFQVTQNEATEPPFRNEFWDNHKAGIYVDVATGEPLFSSLDKFESGTGWPSFSRPIESGRVVSKTDSTLGMVRVEVRSKAGDSHLGHVFDDGPEPTGERYCINSASLRFVPADRLVAEGYGAYAARFAGASAPPLAASTANSCAAPAPGERPGCEATLDTTTVTGGAGARKALSALPGVLEVDDDTVKGKLRVIFDPKVVSGDQLARVASSRP